jgi:hypothetical protein
MGCGIQRATKINIIKSEVYIPKKSSKSTVETINNERKKIDKISKKNWLRIMDFLQYKELKEVGKINRLLNYLSKDDKILIKFFKKKYSIIDYTKNPSVDIIEVSVNYNNTQVQNIIDGVITL